MRRAVGYTAIFCVRRQRRFPIKPTNNAAAAAPKVDGSGTGLSKRTSPWPGIQ
jgi:hypothetical protein